MRRRRPNPQSSSPAPSSATSATSKPVFGSADACELDEWPEPVVLELDEDPLDDDVGGVVVSDPEPEDELPELPELPGSLEPLPLPLLELERVLFDEPDEPDDPDEPSADDPDFESGLAPDGSLSFLPAPSFPAPSPFEPLRLSVR